MDKDVALRRRQDFDEFKRQYDRQRSSSDREQTVEHMQLRPPANLDSSDEDWLRKQIDQLCVADNFRRQGRAIRERAILNRLIGLYVHGGTGSPDEALQARAIEFCASRLTRVVRATARHQNPPLCRPHCLTFIAAVRDRPLAYWRARVEARRLLSSMLVMLVPYRSKGVEYGDGQLDLVEAAALCAMKLRDLGLWSGPMQLAFLYSASKDPHQGSHPSLVTDPLRAATVTERLGYAFHELYSQGKWHGGFLHQRIGKVKST